MPTLNQPRKEKTNQRNEHTQNRELRHKAYNQVAWRKLRIQYLMLHPCCERCLQKDKVTAATDVHHIKSPFRNGVCDQKLFLDETNLMALCKECHSEIHQEQKGRTPEQIIKILEELFNEIPD